MTDRFIPKARTPVPRGLFERAMALGQTLPGKAGYICNRKLKRRFCRRAPDVFAQVMADTHPGDLCLDLGANVGEITRVMARTGADVISYEPDPVTYAALRHNTADFPTVTCVQKAAGAQAGQLMLHRSAGWRADDPLANSQSASLVRSDAGMSADNSVLVDVVDIPAMLTALDRDIRVVKMDIEGSEWDLLEALLDAPVLARIECMFVETHERVNPAVNIARFNRLCARAQTLDRPYINLYWQ
jgi:FkbM family methyltransferase